MQSTVDFLLQSQFRNDLNGREKFFQKRFDYASNLYSKDLRSHYSCVNAIEFSNSCEFLVSGGDDKRVLIWNVNQDILGLKPKPIVMKAMHNSNIFTLAWDNEDKRCFSGANDHQVIVHDVNTREVCDIFLHENAVLCISVHPTQSQIFATACESGQISLYDLRLSNSDPIILASTSSLTSSNSSSSLSSSSSYSLDQTGGAFNSCHFNPIDSNLLAVANEITGVSLIELRMNSTIIRYKSGNTCKTGKGSKYSSKSECNQNGMCVRFNSNGTHLAALIAKSRPILYESNNATPLYQFDNEGYKNACTLKSCCFAGNSDQYLVSGSDDFNVHVWKIPSLNYNSSSTNKDHESNHISEAHLKLQGHRSIVNQCRFNSKYHLLGTSGVEKIIKMWTTYELPGQSNGGLTGRKNEYPLKRKMYTFNELFALRSNDASNNTDETINNLAQNSMSDPYDQIIENYVPVIRNRSAIVDQEESLEEDKLIIAFFDSQVRREERKQQRIDHTQSGCLKSKRLKNEKKGSSDSQNNLNTQVCDHEDEIEQDSEDEISDFDQAFDSNDITTESEYSSSSASSSRSDDDNNEAKNSKTRYSYSSDSSSSENERDESDDEDHFGIQKFRKNLSKNESKSKKQKIIPLRDRLRNLRHRQTLNLTEQSDYLNVLEKLNVKREKIEDMSDKLTNCINSNTIESNSLNQIFNDVNPCTSQQVGSFSVEENEIPIIEKIIRKSSIKNLNEQKRKIEMDKDADNENSACSSSIILPEDDPNQLVFFKKSKRNQTNKTKPKSD